MILCDKGLFTLHTKHTTYQMKADGLGVLLHTYYEIGRASCRERV